MKEVYVAEIAGGWSNSLSLARQAVSHNLMHIFIEALNFDPGVRWYPSPWFIPSDA